MYLPTEFEGYPLRKDFPLLARMVKPWPGIVDVEPMPTEDASRRGRPPARGRAGRAPGDGCRPADVTDETVEDAPRTTRVCVSGKDRNRASSADTERLSQPVRGRSRS